MKKIDYHLDLQGKVGPYMMLESHLALNEMAKDKVLEVITDYYPARQAIPPLVRELGYSCDLIDRDSRIFRFLIWKC